MSSEFARSKGNGIGLTLSCYILTLLSMATVGAIVPLVARFAQHLHVTVAQFGAGIALFSFPSALFSIVVGQVCDRIGSRRVLLLSAIVAIATDAVLFAAGSYFVFSVGLLVAGMAFAGIVVSAPALLMAQLEDGARAQALSIWSTYAPAGVAVGLLLSAPFADGPHWRNGLVIHAGLMIVTLAFAMILASRSDGSSARQQPNARQPMIALFRNISVTRLAIALAVPSAISYGTSLLAPSYLATTHGVSLASASTVVALAKILVVISGGFFAGWLLARNFSARTLFGWLAGIGIAAQVSFFYPDGGFGLALTGLAIWLFAYAGIAAIAMAMLPLLLDDMGQAGAANGLVSQIVSCASFMAPIAYFSDHSWAFFPLICIVGMVVAFAILPKPALSSPRVIAPKNVPAN